MANKSVNVTVFGAGLEPQMPATSFPVVVHTATLPPTENVPGAVEKNPAFFVGFMAWDRALTIDPDSLDLTAGSHLTIMMDQNDLGDLERLSRLVEHPRLRDVDIDVHVEKTSG